MADDMDYARLKAGLVNIYRQATRFSHRMDGVVIELDHLTEDTSGRQVDIGNCAAAIGQMQNSINYISSAVAASSSEIAALSNRVEQVVERSNELRTAAAQIGQFIGLIDRIAKQTGLLSLNATIEAARAGDAGRGFAVVATEVKTLSSQTAAATVNIHSRISLIYDAVETTASGISDIRSDMVRIDDAMTGISATCAEQNAAIVEISSTIANAIDRLNILRDAMETVRTGAAGDRERVLRIAAVARDHLDAGDLKTIDDSQEDNHENA